MDSLLLDSNTTTDSNNDHPDYLTYLALGESIVTVALFAIVVGTVGSLLYSLRFRPNVLRVKELSALMYAYFWTHLLGAFFCFP